MTASKVIHIRAPAKGPGGRPRADDDWRRRTQRARDTHRGTVPVMVATGGDRRPPLPKTPPKASFLSPVGRKRFREIATQQRAFDDAPGTRAWLTKDDIDAVVHVCHLFEAWYEIRAKAKMGSGDGFVNDVREAKIAVDAFEKYKKAFEGLGFVPAAMDKHIDDDAGDPASDDFGD